MNRLDALFRRLAARGYFEVSPGEMIDHDLDEYRDGTTYYAAPRPCVFVVWAPKGQGGPRGPIRFNPFCSRSFAGWTLTEALDKAVEATSPRYSSLDDVVAEHLGNRDVVRGLMALPIWRWAASE